MKQLATDGRAAKKMRQHEPSSLFTRFPDASSLNEHRLLLLLLLLVHRELWSPGVDKLAASRARSDQRVYRNPSTRGRENATLRRIERGSPCPGMISHLAFRCSRACFDSLELEPSIIPLMARRCHRFVPPRAGWNLVSITVCYLEWRYFDKMEGSNPFAASRSNAECTGARTTVRCLLLVIPWF